MRFLWGLVYRALRLYWGLMKPFTVGVRVLLLRDEEILLVRHPVLAGWYLPGGGVKRGETLEEAIRREAAEEVGATLGEMQLLGVYTNLQEGKSDHIAVFTCHDFTLGGETDREVERFELSPLDHLPADVSPGTGRRIREYLQGDVARVGVW